MSLQTIISLLYELLLAIVAGIGLFLQHIFEIFFPPKLKDVRGQLVLITGGANGLGRELALQFASYGCNIAIVDIDFKNAKQTVADVRKLGVKAEAFQTDVSTFNEIDRLKPEVETKLGFVDILVNNAAIFYIKDITEETPGNLMKMINVNLMSLFWTNRIFLNGMVERKRGHIVAICTAGALFGQPEKITYNTSKFGMRGFMESLALQLHHRRQSEFIKTTCAFPSFINTNKFAIDTANLSFKSGPILLDLKTTASEILKGILRNQEILVLPRSYYYLMYLCNFPISFKKKIVETIFKKEFRGLHSTEQ